jgi:ubiquinone/menaquinone biosynthesis C-methylase UbiE
MKGEDMEKASTKCLMCGRVSPFDVCKECADLMRDRKTRQKVYDSRYQIYNVDHGRVDCEFINDLISPEMTVLELGAGAGHLSNMCMNLTDHVISTDFSPAMAYKARRSYSNLEICIADAEAQLPFKESSFDVIISSEVIEHLFNITIHLEQIRRLLKKNGLYIIKTPNKTLESVYNHMSKKDNYYYRSFHPSIQSYFSLKNILIKNGFKPTFLRMAKLSQSQKNKIGFNAGIKCVQTLLKYSPYCLQPSLICIARKIYP